MHFLSLSYPSGSLAIGSALGLSLFERGMVSIVRGGIPIDLALCDAWRRAASALPINHIS